jgi:hypothetical protein
MGQQQLLLIVLGVIIVGIAVVVGINLFNANAEESMKDTISSEGLNLGAMAQQFYKKPLALGGGGNTFTNGGPAGDGWSIPVKLQKTAAADWITVAPNVTDTLVTMTGTPLDEAYTWTIIVSVTPSTLEAVYTP